MRTQIYKFLNIYSKGKIYLRLIALHTQNKCFKLGEQAEVFIDLSGLSKYVNHVQEKIMMRSWQGENILKIEIRAEGWQK